MKTRRFHLDNKTAVFSTSDAVSRAWLGRYADDELHEPALTKILLGELAHARCFVDVGAFLGYYTVLAKISMAQGIVHAFELDERNFRRLAKNNALNDGVPTRLNHAGVGSDVRRVLYMKGADPFGAAHRIAEKDHFVQSGVHATIERIRGRLRYSNMETLDNYFKGQDAPPDVIKIDVEGAELNVLLGMSNLLEEGHELKIFIEIHPGAMTRFFGTSPGQVLAVLEESGFTCEEIGDFRNSTATQRPTLRAVTSSTDLHENTVIYARRPRI